MTNALAREKSPYLRAHANNPVDWMPWGPEALDLALRQDKPLFVSVGYFACHWCHVMAREAFSDRDVAGQLNADFVSIKVDREERPDLDQVLQVAHQALTGRGGGWPLSVFLEPETLTPFFAGTYFPLQSRYGLPGFAVLLERVAAAWHEHRSDLVQQGRQLRQLLTDQLDSEAGQAGAAPGVRVAETLQDHLVSGFDAVHGGFGSAPKFPQCPALAFLLAWGEDSVLPRTLDAMAAGGLRDHVGGGFFRYTVDAAWQVPHFEKMLGDNAQLLAIYAEAAWRWQRDEYRHVALQTADFIEAELALPEAGYATSLNAEAGGDEGGYYLWDNGEVRGILGDAAYPAFAAAYGLARPPAAEGRWHLARIDGGRGGFDAELARLREARETRLRPERDDKRLTRLNALLATALARTALLLDVSGPGRRAVAIVDRLAVSAIDGDRVFACAWKGEAYQPGFLADYACLAEAALAVAALGRGEEWIALARHLADVMLERFRNPAGGLAMTDADVRNPLYRPRGLADDALPSGAGAAVRVWTMLGQLLALPQYLDAVEVALRFAGADLERNPDAHASLITAYGTWLDPAPLVVLSGDERMRAWAVAAARADPRAQVLHLQGDAVSPELAQFAAHGSGVAHVCRGTTCSAPVTGVDALLGLLCDPESRASPD